MIKNNTFRRSIATGRLVFPVVIILSICIWLISSKVWTNFISMGIYTLIGYMLIETNTKFSIIRNRTTLHVSFYFIFTSVCIFIHNFCADIFIPLFILLSLIHLFSGYENNKASGHIFSSFLYLTISGLISQIFFFYIPIYILSMIGLRCANLKYFLSALIGIITPFWILFVYSFWFDKMYFFYKPILNVANINPLLFSRTTSTEIISMVLISILSLVAIFHYFSSSFSEKTQTRAYILFLIVIEIWTLLLSLINPESLTNLIQVNILCSSILLGHFFTITRSFITNIFFIISIVTIISLATYNIWIQYFSFF